MTSRLAFQDRTSLAMLALLAVLLLLGTVFSIAAPQFLSARNLSMLLIEFSMTSVLALGMLLLILPGHIDLSAGSGVGLTGGITAVLIMHHQVPAPVAMLVALAVALLVWRGMGHIIVSQSIPAFIITLGGLLTCKGVFWLIIQNTTVPVSPGGAPNLLAILTTYYLPPRPSYVLAGLTILVLALLRWRSYQQQKLRGPVDKELQLLSFLVPAQVIALVVLCCGQFRGLPLPSLILLVVALFVHVLLTHTRFGRALYAIGSNEEAAFLSGIPVGKTVVAAYTLMGALVAVTGFMQTAYAGASTTTVGDLMELDAVAACVIGGASLRGGRGSALGVLLGSLVMACLLSGMSLLAVPPEARFIARGVVLALSAWLDVRLSRLS
jgi:D-xylose transport system permease protein